MLARKVRMVSGGEGLDVGGVVEGVLLSRVERRVVDVVGVGAEEVVCVEEEEREEYEEKWGVISS